MKKVTKVLFFSIFIFFIILSCTNNEDNVNFEVSLSENNNEIYSTWVNNTDNEIVFGESYSIEKLIGNSWNHIEPKKTAVFHAILNSVKPKTKKEHVYDIDSYDMDKGRYRIIVEYAIMKNYKQEDKKRISKEFKVPN